MKDNADNKQTSVFWRYVWPYGIGISGGLFMKNIDDLSQGAAVVIMMILLGLAPKFPRTY